MNLSEFKAWFEGFSENLTGTPDKKAWARIQEKIGQIQNAPATTYPVFVDRWWNNRPYYNSYYGQGISGMGTGLAQGVLQNSQSALCGAVQSSGANEMIQSIAAASTFEPTEAFRALGRAEFQNMN